MSRSRVLVLGAAGRLGHAAADAFGAAGWSVTSLVRPGGRGRAPRNSIIVEADALDRAAVNETARGHDLILHALNPPYTEWAKAALPLAHAAIEAAATARATLMFSGNVYNYGAGLPAVLDETTPMRPSARKGHLRVQIEDHMQEATERGLRTIILRAGDFFGGGRGSWLDLVILKDIARGRLTYPGQLDLVHEWAYLPDFAAALVRLADARDKFEGFEAFGFPGHAVTGREFVSAIVKAVGHGLKVRPMSWWLIHLLRPIVPICRELSEMAYLWQEPHSIAGDKLKAAIGDIPHTPLDEAMARALRALGLRV
jgi:nucleoside-diphosphate-sugar epimerase